MAGCAGQPAATATLEVNVQAPMAIIEQGRSFNVTLQLKNISQHEAQLTEIRLPAKLLGAFIYEGSLPAVTLTKSADGSGILRPEITLNPGSSLEFVFCFTALDPGDYFETGFLIVNEVSYPFTLQTQVRGTNPAGWRPGISTRPQELVNADTIDQALVQIKALIEVNGEQKVGWTASGALISPDGLILTNARAVLGNRFYPVKDLIVALTVTPGAAPVEKYLASIVQVNEALDIAVLKLRSDITGTPLDYGSLQLPALPMASIPSAYLPGEPLTFWGYPADENLPLNQIESLVVGLQAEPQAGEQTRIITSLEAEGSYLGWVATNSIGELVGLASQPTALSTSTCRALLDTNRDGLVDGQDACLPSQGSLSWLHSASDMGDILSAAFRGEVVFQRLAAEGLPFEPEGEIILREDFSDIAPSWHAFQNENGTAQVEGEQLSLQVTQPFSLVLSAADIAYDELSFSAETRVITASKNGDFGLLCGLVDDQHFIALEVSEDGYFSIWKRNGSQTVTLVDWTYAEIIATGGTLKLTAECGPSGLKLAVNDSRLAQVIDPQFTPGAIGVIVGTLSSPGLKVGFDNVEIRIP